MSLLSLSDKYVITAKACQLDCFDSSNHYIIETPVVPKSDANDNIVDVVMSPDSKHLAVITSTSKQLVIYELAERKLLQTYILPRSASKIRFTPNGKQVLVADKSGDVLIYDIEDMKSGIKLLGHLSLLLDILQTDDENFIISCDRDEKIKVSRYPNTYNIQTYCLGHKEFVKYIEMLPHDSTYLTSASGDGTVKIWDVINGKNCHTIDTNDDVSNEIKNDFVKVMDAIEIEVTKLPIVHYAITKLDDNCSIFTVSLYNCNELFIYSLHSAENQFSHKLEKKLHLDSFPTSVGLHNKKLYICNNTELCITVYSIVSCNDKINVDYVEKIKIFDNWNSTDKTDSCCLESIKILYKRKFDNVQEYQERKKQRLVKTAK